jgi:hypothetical protein
MATRTSAATGLFSAGTTWVGGVAPVDTDAFVIADTHIVTFDMDQSAWAGCAASTINAGGTLIASTTAGAYVLKMNADLTNNGTIQAGTSIAVPYPATCTFTINFSSTANSFECGGAGVILFYCTQPANKVIQLSAAEAIGQTILSVDTSVVGDWADGNTVMIVENDKVYETPEERVIAAGGIAAGTITVTAGLTAAKNDDAWIALITRNIRVIGATGYVVKSPINSYIAAEFYGDFDYMIYIGTNTTFAGTARCTSGTSYVLHTCPSCDTSGVMAGVTYGVYGSVGENSGYILGASYGLQGCIGYRNSGLIGGCAYGIGQCFNCLNRGDITGCTTGFTSGADNINSSTGTVTNCTRGAIQESGLRFGGSFSSNTYDFDLAYSGVCYNMTLGSATEFYRYNTIRTAWHYVESFDHDQVVNAYKAWCRGGIVSSQTASPPTGYTIFYDHEVESALYPCFRQYLATVLPGTAIEVSAVIRNTDGIDVSATSPIDLRPRLEIIDVFDDPLVRTAATALDSDPIAVSNGTNTDWQDVDVIWANTGDSPRQVYVRIICYSHDASTHAIDEAWSVADYQDQIADIQKRVKRLAPCSEV